jgi:hypothetical protein
MASAFACGRRHGVVTETAPRLASADAFDAKPASFHWSMKLNGFYEILGTGRNKAAARIWSAQFVENRRKDDLVEANQLDQDPFHAGLGEGASDG